MKNTKESGLAVITAVALTCIFCFAATESMAAAFTYQGRLNLQGDPAVGRYDFAFALYDSPEGGRRIGPPVFRSEVELSNGFFTVDLDFGPDPSVFNGLTRYLEIGVQRSGLKAPAVLLTPRQKISVTPYAHTAFTAQQCKPLKFMTDFVVRMDIADEPSQYFHHFNWLKSQTEIVLYRDGTSNNVRKIPGRTAVADLELNRFLSENRYLQEWIKRVQEGDLSSRNITIWLFNQTGRAVDGWTMINAWPSTLRYETNDSFATVVEKAVIVAEQINRASVEEVMPDHWYPPQQPVVQLPLLVEIQGQPLREFDEMEGLGWNVQVVEYREGSEFIVHKLPGESTVMDIALARRVANDDKPLYDWRTDVINGAVNKKIVSVFMQDARGAEVLLMHLFDGWPAEFGTSWDPAKNRMEEKLVVAADRLE